MASTAEAAKALFDHAALLASTGPTLPISWPEHSEPVTGKSFTPPENGRYLEVAFFSNAPAWEGIADGELKQGLLTITVVWKKNQGTIAAFTAADQVISHFPKGLPLHEGATGIEINRKAWASSPLSEAASLRIPVTIPWVAS